MFLVPEEGSQQPPVPVYTCKASNQANTVEEGVEMRYVEEGGALGGDPGEWPVFFFCGTIQSNDFFFQV